ncbi:MAG TPA: ROK family protein, partial [Spirochaetia bacterium]|nr:ROK family protein [Spirochaetia bacterium]
KGTGHVLGIEIQTERYSAVALDLEGRIVQSRSIPFSWDGRHLSTVFLEIVSEATQALDISGDGLLGIGVGLSGIVDSSTGTIRQSLPLGVTSPLDFYSSSARLIGKPLCIDNDANCCCWAQLVRGRDARPREFLFILGEFRKERAGDLGGGGLSVGLGLVLGGRVHLGASSSAGEFRSVFRTSETGSQFSVEPAVMERAENDPSAFERVARELGRNVALLVNTLDLSHVFIGGNIERRQRELVPILEKEIESNWPYGRKSLSIEASELGELVVAYGAAAMFLERLFSLPQIQEHSVPVGVSAG